MWTCLECGKQFYKFRLKCNNCGGFVQTKEVRDIHVDTHCLAKRPIADTGLKLYKALSKKEVFALVEVDLSTYADLAFVNIGDGPKGHAEVHLVSCLKKLIISQDPLLKPRKGRPLVVRMIIKYSPCFSVCSKHLCNFKRWLDAKNRGDIILVLDFYKAYLEDGGKNTTVIDRLIEAGLVIPNYIAERGIDEVEYAIRQIERHFLTLELQGSVTRNDPLLGVCVRYIHQAMGALGIVHEESGSAPVKLDRGIHFSCAEHALTQVEDLLEMLLTTSKQLGKADIKELRDELAAIRRGIRGDVDKQLSA